MLSAVDPSCVMATLISTDSPVYVRRLVRELNGHVDGFYFGEKRFSRARFSKGRLQARAVSGERWSDITTECRDAHGRDIFASRQ